MWTALDDHSRTEMAKSGQEFSDGTQSNIFKLSLQLQVISGWHGNPKNVYGNTPWVPLYQREDCVMSTSHPGVLVHTIVYDGTNVMVLNNIDSAEEIKNTNDDHDRRMYDSWGHDRNIVSLCMIALECSCMPIDVHTFAHIWYVWYVTAHKVHRFACHGNATLFSFRIPLRVDRS